MTPRRRWGATVQKQTIHRQILTLQLHCRFMSLHPCRHSASSVGPTRTQADPLGIYICLQSRGVLENASVGFLDPTLCMFLAGASALGGIFDGRHSKTLLQLIGQVCYVLEGQLRTCIPRGDFLLFWDSIFLRFFFFCMDRFQRCFRLAELLFAPKDWLRPFAFWPWPNLVSFLLGSLGLACFSFDN